MEKSNELLYKLNVFHNHLFSFALATVAITQWFGHCTDLRVAPDNSNVRRLVRQTRSNYGVLAAVRELVNIMNANEISHSKSVGNLCGEDVKETAA